MDFVAASLPRYELRSNDFTTSHLEGWFTSNIWSIVIDACFVDLEIVEFIGKQCYLYLALIFASSSCYIINLAFRGEGCSRASGERKNCGRSNSKVKMLLGRKCDGIVQELRSPEEYAISEEGRHWTGKDGTKYLADGCLKLPKVMRDVLHQKLRKHGIDFVRSRQMEIVGFLHSAQHLQVLVIDTPSGYMSRIRRYPPSKIPPTFAEVDDLISMIHEVLVGKEYNPYLQFSTYSVSDRAMPGAFKHCKPNQQRSSEGAPEEKGYQIASR
ncbi:hypothetical protein BC936DRAFT_147344 [Jimgerdemannia flammicorona]|uniref:Uncharacterized protein n=1 Tax=Jimgerdemannia flammicorona TaxID=994334 RepID=A0A433D5I5_9FUNG|nr:hypothetical protein BC936DRAFT_147344 [Jimgerdemannia flammicorona]